MAHLNGSMAEQVAEMESLFSKLPEKDRAFAQSLLDQAKKKSLSSKQAYWFGKLLERAKGVSVQSAAPVKDARFGGVYKLFERALSIGKLKRPAITLRAESGEVVKLYVAGAGSKEPGVVNVTDGQPYGFSKWYGRIYPNGTWQPGRAAPSEAIRNLVRELGEDPAMVASIHGRRTGGCCFCNRELTDDRSVAVGYGPICAGHYGLPWSAEEATAVLAGSAAGAPGALEKAMQAAEAAGDRAQTRRDEANKYAARAAMEDAR